MSPNGTDFSVLVDEVEWTALRIPSAIPGRIRLRSEQFRDDGALLERVRRTLDSMDAIEAAEVNVRTGSVLVHYDADGLDDLPSLIDRVAALGVLPEAVDPAALKERARAHSDGATAQNFSEAVQHAGRWANDRVADATGGTLDLKGLAPLTLTGLGLRRVLSGAPLAPVPWFNYFWFALTLLIAFQPDASASTPADAPAHDGTGDGQATKETAVSGA